MLRRLQATSLVLRRHISALYATGDKAKENFVVLTPFMNFEERVNNFDEIESNLKRRKSKLNLDEFKKEYELYKAIEDRKRVIEKRRDEIVKLMRESSTEALKIQGRQAKEDLRLLKENSYHLEDNFVHNYLSLPNVIHDITPLDGKRVIFTYEDETKPHQSKLPNLLDELIEFYDPTCYYMKGEAAMFDVFMPMKVLDYYQEKGFINFCNPDFTRSIIAEGAGVDINELLLIKEDDVENKLNNLHLAGSASFLNYLSFVTKLTIFPSLMPMKLICTGKQYNVKNHFEHQDLYNVVQSTCCQSFIATADGSTFDTIFSEQIENFIKIFETFNQHFRIVYYPADELELAESCKLGVEMFSPGRNKFIEVGNFSYYGDFISKRLLFNYKIGKKFHFPHIYSGTVVNVTKLLLVLLENNNELKYD